jgi:CubicO group peptidase (beta-lactamase class C family)
MRSRHENTKTTTVFAVSFGAFVVSWLLIPSLLATSQKSEPSAVFPRTRWDAIERPESVGFSVKRLDAVRAWMSTLDTTAMMVVVGGRTLLTYGDVTDVSYLASGRKSVLSLLYGKYVDNGTIDLDRKLSQLQFTDVGGLMPRELDATIRHLLTARSGVYHPPSNGGDDTANAPARGSVAPGDRFVYNNWDFNAAGAVFEKLTGRDIYDALDEDIARPIGMEDFDRARQRKSGNAAVSQFPAYHVWLSTRDMARLGLLTLRAGAWAGRQVIPGEWVRRVTGLVTPHRDTNAAFPDSPPSVDRWGYGYLFWVWDADNPADPLKGASTAWGVGGQYITVIPQLDMVIAHKTDTGFGQTASSDRAAPPRRKAVTATQYDVVLKMLVSAKCGDRCR